MISSIRPIEPEQTISNLDTISQAADLTRERCVPEFGPFMVGVRRVTERTTSNSWSLRHPRFQGWHCGSRPIRIPGSSQQFMNQPVCQPLSRAVHFVFAVIFVTATLWSPTVTTAAETLPAFTGEKTAWHGFDRYDFVMDEATL